MSQISAKTLSIAITSIDSLAKDLDIKIKLMGEDVISYEPLELLDLELAQMELKKI